MATSILDSEVKATLDGARRSATEETLRTIMLDGQNVEVSPPFPSPEDWRDQWIYFLMVDRFNNPTAPPHQLPYDSIMGTFQGGTLNGVREQLPYLKKLGVGALWISPVLKNCQYLQGTYHGYGIQDFLNIDPRFASSPAVAEHELRALVDAAHALGIYVILDIVLNHTGDVFAYQCRAGDTTCESTNGDLASFTNQPYAVEWRDENGNARPDWPVGEQIQNPPANATVWPVELRNNANFRRQGMPGAVEAIGDFYSLRQLLTGYAPVQNTLVRAYQYLVAKYDIDGFRIDTLKYINPGFAQIFGNAMREFALSIGKKNFFSFGEVAGDEQTIARFIGRNALQPGDLIGVDAALDFPLFNRLPHIAKGFEAPIDLAQMYEMRKQVELGILSSHGEATHFFVTFLDNHDQYGRFYAPSTATPHQYDDQVTLGLGCLFALQGIPCVYYGTEQGLHGQGNVPEAVREALWGKPGAFDPAFPFYKDLQQIASVRATQPALRYGRQYFRQLSGDLTHFGLSTNAPGVIAFSRILNDKEVVVVANTNTQNEVTSLGVIIDEMLNSPGETYTVLYSNKPNYTQPSPIQEAGQNITVQQLDGSTTSGPVSFITVTLQPMEIQILSK